ncbi:hypothetical protein H4R20_004183 [Coemansia guatemalensis]|uniref:GH18 domain-containing protein n=1 Tax=Coemansia guatemalensis TaxID=2761395 RepID=A0A9W8HU66_9FUNG|nr:hypothetical protein H4R20_004183 [Coemansia guatemalensis]
MSVGGWTGSNYFSNIVKDSGASSNLVSSMVNYVKTNDLDGIDIDWEYPGRLGDTCNVYDEANDTPNYLKFLQSLRTAFDSNFGAGKKLITLAVCVQPFDINRAPSTDVSQFAKVVDYANLMQYDINGGWNNDTGPNAPLNFEKGKGLQVSFVSAIEDWTKAGWPANKLTAGIGFYGRSTIAKEDMTKDSKNQYQPQEQTVPLGDSEDAPWYDACAGTTANSGTWQWKHLRDQGILTGPSTAASPWVRQWDDVSQTPWLFNPSTKQFISYDDPESLKIKLDYAASKGLAGSMIWSINMDYNNELLDTVLTWKSGGPPEPSSSSSETSATDSQSTQTTSSTPSTTTNSHTLSTTALPEPTQSTTTSEGGPSNGGKCPSDGIYRCADSSGKSPSYFLCLYGTWTMRSCGSGTACYQSDSSITCNWPSS